MNSNNTLGRERRRSVTAWRRGGLYRFEDDIDLATTRPGKLRPPPGQFSGWSQPVPLGDVLPPRRRGQQGGPLHDNQHRLYRLYVRGERRPLYIGMTRTGVAGRVRRHYRGAEGGSRELYDLLRDLDRQRGAGWVEQNVMVQTGSITHYPRNRIDMKLLHQYELDLQRRENPQVYNPGEWTFEEFEEMVDCFSNERFVNI